MLLLPVLKAVGPPGSLLFLLLCAGAGLTLTYWPRTRRWGRRWLVAIFAAYLVMSLPLFAHAIAGALPPLHAGSVLKGNDVPPPQLDTLIVVDGENPMTRIDEAVRAFKTFSPRRIVVIGDQWIMETIAWEGVPRRLIVRDSNPPTTRSQVARVTELVYEGNLGRTALIASRLQMPRILALLQREHLEMLLLPSPLEREPPSSVLAQAAP